MRTLDVHILRVEQLFDRKRQFLFKRFSIRFLCCVLTGFGCLQQGVVSSAEVSLDVAPGALNSPANGARLIHIVDAFLMQNLFEIAAELRTFQRLGREVAPQMLILQMLADILKTFLSVDEALNDGPQGFFNLLVVQFPGCCLNSHGILPITVRCVGI
jgi:hypothetical protein